MKKEQFVERGTDYTFDNGTLSVYETNCPCKNVEFRFARYMITLMLSGHKTIVTPELNIEFYPEMLFIPEKNTRHLIEISNASFTNPTKCLVLDVSPDYLKKFYLKHKEQCQEYNVNEEYDSTTLTHFFSNNQETINTFKRFYKSIKSAKSMADQLLANQILEELLSRIFLTDARQLLLENFEEHLNDRIIEKTVRYIQNNFKNKITINELAELYGSGKTKFFNSFRKNLGVTPINYIMNERVKYSKALIGRSDNLKSVAYQSGFNTYEHFYKSFKKIEGISPMVYKKKIKSALEVS